MKLAITSVVRLALLTFTAATAALVVSVPARAASIQTLTIPSACVDPTRVVMADPPPGKASRPPALRVNVRLPDGYDGHRRYPVLYLLEGGGAYDYWQDFSYGELEKAVHDLRAIVVMPEAGVVATFGNSWNHGGLRTPCWEHYYLDELIPAIADRYRIRSGRRWHAVGGFSSGGLGAAQYAAKKPGYFGQMLSFSGVLDIQNPFVESNAGSLFVLGLFSTAKIAETGPTPWTDVFGDPRAQEFYWAAHNPPVLAPALTHTRIYVSHGVPTTPTCVDAQQPQYHCVSQEVLGGVGESTINRDWAQTFMAAARRAGADVTYRPLPGGHWYGYSAQRLADAIQHWGLFKRVTARPRTWTYLTASTTGDMWGYRFRFHEAPGVLETFRRDGDRLRGDGTGTVEIRTPSGQAFTEHLPFARQLPGAGRRIHLSVRPRTSQVGTRTTFRFKATVRRGGKRRALPGARIRFAGRAATTGRDGRGRIARRFWNAGRRHASACKRGHSCGRAVVRVVG